VLGLGVLVLHTVMLGGWAGAPGIGRAPVLQVRQIVVAPTPVAQAEPVAPAPTEARQPPPPAARQERAALPPSAAPTADATPPAPPAGDTAPPVYATRTPAAATLRYEARRNQRSGEAELLWQPEADGYRLQLIGTGLGMGLASAGGFDGAGLAPLRHTEVRRGRELRAANFQRDSGRITYSGPAVEHPLLPGAQDRLSWLVQLASVLNADAALAEPGTQLRMVVAGARGDTEVWLFTVQPPAELDLPAGRVVGAVHLLREPRRAYDTEVQVWLDPAREHLPVQLWLRLRATGEGTELRLAAAGP
jgi:hypothetical protein